MTNLRLGFLSAFSPFRLSYVTSTLPTNVRHLGDRRTKADIDLRGIEERATSTPNGLSCLVLTMWPQTLYFTARSTLMIKHALENRNVPWILLSQLFQL
jgi:hypothetical protein